MRTGRPEGGHPDALVIEPMEELACCDALVAITVLPLLEGIPVTPSVDITAGLAAFRQRLDDLVGDRPEQSESALPHSPQHYWDRVVQLIDQPDSAEDRFRQYRSYLELVNGAWAAPAVPPAGVHRCGAAERAATSTSTSFWACYDGAAGHRHDPAVFRQGGA